MEPKKKKLIGEIFIEEGLINEEQLKGALLEGKENGMLLGQVLLKKGFIKEDDLAKALSIQLGYPYLSLKDITIPQDTLSSFSETLVKRYKVIPISKNNKILKVGMTNPQNQPLIDELVKISGYNIEPCVCTATDVLLKINKYYGEAGMVGNFLASEKEKRKVGKEINADEYKYTINDSVTVVDQIINKALTAKIKEVHIEHMSDSLRVRFRNDDKSLTEIQRLKNELKSFVISNIKGRGGLDISLKDTVQKGKFTTHFEGDEVIVSIGSIPVKLGESIIMNFIYKDNTAVKTLPMLGAEISDVSNIEKILHSRDGIVFIAGPKGSGKTATLYSIINMLNKPNINIFTIEDVVSSSIDGANQIELNPAKGFLFKNAVEAALSNNPDILIFDTKVDSSTIETIFNISLARCFVISVVDIANTFDIFPYLSNLGISPYVSASSINGIIGQKIFKMICENCIYEYPVTEEHKFNIKLPEDIKTLHKGRGCIKCNNTGSRGKTAIFEVFEINDEAKKLIADGMNIDQLKFLFENSGIRTIKKKLIDRIKDGTIDICECK